MVSDGLKEPAKTCTRTKAECIRTKPRYILTSDSAIPGIMVIILRNASDTITDHAFVTFETHMRGSIPIDEEWETENMYSLSGYQTI